VQDELAFAACMQDAPEHYGGRAQISNNALVTRLKDVPKDTLFAKSSTKDFVENQHVMKNQPSVVLAINRDIEVPFRFVAMSFIEARPVVQGIFSLRFFVGGLAPIGSHFLPAATRSAMLTTGIRGQSAWLAATWFVYLLNGISDITPDKINGSKRPLASGRLSARQAIWICVALATFAIAFAATVGIVLTIMTATTLMLGVLYSVGRRATKLSSVPSSLTVGLAGFLTYTAGQISYAGTVSWQLCAYALIMSGWMAVAGNFKDFGQETGDLIAGRRSLVALLGRRPAARAVWTVSLIVATIGTALAGVDRNLLSLTLLMPAVTIMSLSWIRQGASPNFVRMPYRTFMVSQYVVNVSAAALWLAGIEQAWK
jgi:4-hydroxybenzoate polyprenyltransferase